MNGAEQYIEDVLAGRVVVCQWVRLAVERHMRDLRNGHKRGLHFDRKAAQYALDFYPFLKHSKGEWAGKPVTLEPWEQFFIWVVFGWMREDGTRRFRTAYLEVARKNGKSTLAAGTGIFLLVADGEGGAEVYTAATKRDQAKIAHSEATRMVRSSPALRKMIRVYKDNLMIEGTASKMEPLGADADTLDGLNIHGAIVDELHAHKNRDLWDVLETATGARRQPLMMAITTAGYNRQSLCFQFHDYTQKILKNWKTFQDDAWFGIIYSLDEGDDWQDESTWVKANPNLGVSKKLELMREKARKAKQMPSALNAFLRLELNQWTQSSTRWIKWEHWDACGKPVEIEALRGRRCFLGLDLSSTIDITAVALVFPPEGAEEDYQVLMRFWIPEESMRERVKRDQVHYDVWVDEDLITATPGNAVDYDFILDQIDQDAQNFDIVEIAFDPWNATSVEQKLAERGLTVVKFRQGFASMSPAMKEFQRLLMLHRICHDNNPVLGWMADNLVASEDPAGNIKPDKGKSTERIDGMVALIMGLGRAVLNSDAEGSSAYDEHGLREL